jgi:hypothetical protein
MKTRILALLFIVFSHYIVSYSQKITIEKHPEQTDLYQPIYIDFSTTIISGNPYKQDDIKVDMQIMAPDKKELLLPCFYMKNEKSQMQWQARFLPRQKGKYSFFIRFQAKENVYTSIQDSFTVVSSNNKGMLSLDKEQPCFMKFDNGSKFRGIGMNICWEFEPKWDVFSPKYTFPQYFNELAENKGNYVRFWICPWNMPIEWTPVKTYKVLLDEMADFSKIKDHSSDLKINKGTTPVA